MRLWLIAYGICLSRNIILTYRRAVRLFDDYQTSVLEEPIKSGEILSYTDKYMGGSKGKTGMQSAQKRIPADLPENETARIKELAGKTFAVLSCHGVSRVDMIIDRDNRNIYVNEISLLPWRINMFG